MHQWFYKDFPAYTPQTTLNFIFEHRHRRRKAKLASPMGVTGCPVNYKAISILQTRLNWVPVMSYRFPRRQKLRSFRRRILWLSDPVKIHWTFLGEEQRMAVVYRPWECFPFWTFTFLFSFQHQDESGRVPSEEEGVDQVPKLSKSQSPPSLVKKNALSRR